MSSSRDGDTFDRIGAEAAVLEPSFAGSGLVPGAGGAAYDFPIVRAR